MLTYSAIFERALRLNPEGIAVDANDARLTYRGLDAVQRRLRTCLSRGESGERNVSSVSAFHVLLP